MYLVFKQCSFPLNTMVFNITEHVQGVQYLLRFWRSDGVLNLNTHFYSVVFDLFCIFRENTHEQQLIQAKILYQCPSRNILDFFHGGSHFSTGVIFLRVRHVKNRPVWHFFYTWDTFFYGQGSFLYDEKWPLGRFSTGVVIRRYRQSLIWYNVKDQWQVLSLSCKRQPLTCSQNMYTDKLQIICSFRIRGSPFLYWRNIRASCRQNIGVKVHTGRKWGQGQQQWRSKPGSRRNEWIWYGTYKTNFGLRIEHLDCHSSLK